MSPYSLSVVVPTWRRPDDLRRCLEGLSRQEDPPDEVLVVWRQGDEDVHGILQEWTSPVPLRKVETVRPGVVAAMNRGLEEAVGEIVALTDDDSFPHADWCKRLRQAYRDDSQLVAVGGRDRVHVQGALIEACDVPVGDIAWFGRTRGNHHLGSGPARPVRFLKGVNCSFRKPVLDGLAFDERLRGGGAQVHWELAFFLALGRKGTILYDPSILVDHFPAIRHDADRRDSFSALASRDAAFNETLVLLENLSGPARIAFVAWAFAVGSTAHPGVLQGLRDTVLRRRGLVFLRVSSTLLGRFDALLTIMFSHERAAP